MREDEKIVEDSSATSKFVKIKLKTNSDQIKVEKDYCLSLNKSSSLNECRPIISKELNLQVHWDYLDNGAVLAGGSEHLKTIEEILKDNKYITLQRELSKKEKQKAEADSYTKEEQAKQNAKEKVRREHMEHTHKTLTALQNTLKMGNEKLINPEDVQVLFKDLSKQAASSMNVGGESKDQLRSKKTEDITTLVKSLGLPRTVGRSPGNGGFQALSFVARVKSDDNGSAHTNIANKYTVAVNEIENRVEVFQEEWEKKACESGFSQMAAEISLAYGKGPVKAAVSANYSQGQQSDTASASKSEKIYLVGMQEIKKARVTIPPTEIRLNDEVERQFKRAVKNFNPDKNEEENKQYVNDILFLLDRYGYFVITEYTIGGSLHTSETQDKQGSSSAAAEKFQREFGAALDVSASVVSAAGSFAHKSGNSTDNKQSASKQATNFQLSAKGGNVTDKNNPQKWTSSLAIENWEIISYSRLIPIFEFISDSRTRIKCKQALTVIEKNQKQAQIAQQIAEQEAQRRKILFNRFSDNDREYADEKNPISKDEKGRNFRDSPKAADLTWLELNDDSNARYFKGAKLIVRGDVLQLGVNVTDQDRQNDEWIENSRHNIYKDDRGRLGQSDIYIDTTKLYIPKNHRIVAIRLTGNSIGGGDNRLGLEVKIESLNGDYSYIKNEVNNYDYIDNSRSEDIHPCFSPTIISKDKCVMGIRLKDLGDSTVGIAVLEY